MDIDPVGPRAAQPAADPFSPGERSPQEREIVRAVRAVNQSEMFGGENTLDFQMDPNTRRLVIRLLNRRTREVVERYPAEYILSLAAELNR